MDWPAVNNVDALIRNARHNARFSAVRLPVVLIVSGFLWKLSPPAAALTWSVVMVCVELSATYIRGQLSKGLVAYAAPHLVTLAAMSALWVGFGVLLWQSDTELGRIAATIGLLTTALYGALGGPKDLRTSTILTAPSLCALLVLIGWHAWTHWPLVEALISSLATLGTCFSILACARALHQSDATLQRANTDLEHLAAALSRNAALLEETSSIAQVGGWRFDIQTGHLEWTAETRRIHDVDSDFLPTPAIALDFYAPYSRSQLERAVAAARETGAPWDLELQIRSARGTEKWVRANGKATMIDGVPVNLMGAVADISERVRLEQGLRVAQNLESVGRLAGGMAHDFNNVLTAVIHSADLLKTTRHVDPLHARLVETILRASRHATGLTRSLLAFSRQQVLTPRRTDLNSAIVNAAQLLTSLIPSDIEIVTDCHIHEAPVLVDPGQLGSALVNLAINAKDAMPSGGTLRLCSRIEERPGDAPIAVIVVSDTGAGIDPLIVPRIFEPFFTTKNDRDGTGLGLAMVHGFITQSGGTISVESKVGAGTTFTIAFPLLMSPQDNSDAVSAPAEMTKPTKFMRILLVEDDALVRDAVALTLQDAGHSVVTAADGPQAIRLHETDEVFDLVVADVVLTPSMSGPQLAQVLAERTPGLRTVLVSGYARDKLSETGRLAPGVSFLHKPFTMDELTAHIATGHAEPSKSPGATE